MLASSLCAMIPIEQLMGIGAFSSAIRRTLKRNETTFYCRKRVGGTGPPRNHIRRQDEQATAIAGQATLNVTRAIELPESPKAGSYKLAFNFRIALKTSILLEIAAQSEGAFPLQSFP